MGPRFGVGSCLPQLRCAHCGWPVYPRDSKASLGHQDLTSHSHPEFKDAKLEFGVLWISPHFIASHRSFLLGSGCEEGSLSVHAIAVVTSQRTITVRTSPAYCQCKVARIDLKDKTSRVKLKLSVSHQLVQMLLAKKASQPMDVFKFSSPEIQS